MARVTVNLYATLRRHIGGAASVEMEIGSASVSGQTIREVLDHLGVPAEETRIIFVNGRAAGLSEPLVGGERVGIFPTIGGG